MWSRLALSFQSGDGYIYAILFLTILGFFLLIERIISLQMRYNLNFTKFLIDLKKALAADDLDRAMNISRKAGNSSLPLIALRALEAAERDPTTVRSTIEEETIDFLPNIEARMTIIPALSTVILLIGVLGTIDGLWSAFNSIDVLDTAQKQASLAHSVAGSLNATTMGLLACLVLLAGYQMLRGLALKITDKVHYGVTVLSNLLVPQSAPMMSMPVAAGISDFGTSSASSAHAADDFDVRTEKKDAANDDPFDDSAVDDIQDEEEII